jgi:hypothetical protein
MYIYRLYIYIYILNRKLSKFFVQPPYCSITYDIIVTKTKAAYKIY